MSEAQDKSARVFECEESGRRGSRGAARYLISLLGLRGQELSKFFSLVAMSLFTAGLQFATMVKIANVLGKAGFGDLAYAIVVGTYGSTIILYGLDRTMVRDMIHFPGRFGEFVAASLFLRAGIFGIFILGLVLWIVLSGSGGGFSWGAAAVAAAVSVPSLNLQPVYDVWDKMQRHAVYNLLRRSAYFAAVWAVVLSSPEGLSISLIGLFMLLSAILGIFLEYRWAIARIEFTGPLHIGRATISMIKDNVWVSLAGVGCLSFGGLNQLILKHISGSSDLGGYAVCWQMVALTTLLLMQVARIGKPAVARYSSPASQANNGRVSFLVRYGMIMLAVAAVVGLPSMLFAGPILRTLFRPEYVSAAGTLRVLGAYVMILGVGMAASQYVVAARMERTYFFSVAFGGVLSAVLCFVLIPRYSGLGAALSLLISHGAAMGIYVLAVVKHLRAAGRPWGA
ncbi:MAG: oligosaccharide flippase family protein [Phycisphaerales bacterium]|nr:MAG: oligosaccharide flippase family protein [Phycisphaerales bacterium]